jgi:hypothetical protein
MEGTGQLLQQLRIGDEMGYPAHKRATYSVITGRFTRLSQEWLLSLADQPTSFFGSFSGGLGLCSRLMSVTCSKSSARHSVNMKKQFSQRPN